MFVCYIKDSCIRLGHASELGEIQEGTLIYMLMLMPMVMMMMMITVRYAMNDIGTAAVAAGNKVTLSRYKRDIPLFTMSYIRTNGFSTCRLY